MALLNALRRAGVLKKLSLAGLAQLSQLRYSWLKFGLASAGYRGLAADSSEQNEIPGLARLA